jgi:uncharacterized membrane protein HdeD (DUF308 family)
LELIIRANLPREATRTTVVPVVHQAHLVPHIHHWWCYVVRGAAALAFGVLAFLPPGPGLATLLVLFGGFALINGTFTLILAFRDPRVPRWHSVIFEGLASSVAGVFALLLPGISSLGLLFVFAGWSVLTGMGALIAAIRLRRHVRGEWLLALSGVLSLASGLGLFLLAQVGALHVVLWALFRIGGRPPALSWIGVYAVVFGALLLALGLRLRTCACAPDSRVPAGGDLRAPVR